MAGTWQGLTHQPTFDPGTMILLTDGRIMVQETTTSESATAHWHALSPDSSGNYQNGTWSTLADMNYSRTYFASGVLKDGRVIVCGGEYSSAGSDTNTCEIYDPVADAWSLIPSPPGWTQIGDASCCVLPDGKFMIGSLETTDCAIYDPATSSWWAAGPTAVKTNEETWVLLQDDTILTVECFSPYKSEKFIISSNAWQDEGTVPVTLVDPVMSEIGPAMLLYNGKVIFFGAANSGGHGKTAIYTLPASPNLQGTWSAGPDIPVVGNQTIICNDSPASLLPNGKVLFTAANFIDNAGIPPNNWNWGSPVLFFEYDPVSNTITQAPTPASNGAELYTSRLMLLPTGQVLFRCGAGSIECYTPDGLPQDAWRPTITSVTPHYEHLFTTEYFLVQGTQLNGLSQANMYGDDCTTATNYPLIRVRNTLTNQVYYCRTYEFSTMGVAGGPAPQSFRFQPGNIPDGNYELVVVANGIASYVYHFHYRKVRKPEQLDVFSKHEFEYLGKIVAEGDPWNRRGWAVDPEIIEMRAQLNRLAGQVEELTSLIRSAQLPAVGKKVAREATNGKGHHAKSH